MLLNQAAYDAAPALHQCMMMLLDQAALPAAPALAVAPAVAAVVPAIVWTRTSTSLLLGPWPLSTAEAKACAYVQIHVAEDAFFEYPRW